jgi:hypothetical protein
MSEVERCTRSAVVFRRAIPVGVVAVGVALLASSAVAAGPAPAVSEQQVFTYPTPSLLNAHQQVFQGTKDSAGVCHSGFSAVMRPGDKGKVAVEISRNSGTCSLTFDIGESSLASGTGYPSAPSQSAQSSSTDSASVPVSGLANSAAPAPLAAYKSTSAFFSTKHIDPVGLVVTSVKNTISWQYGNGCIHNPVNMTTNDTWFTPTKWFRTAHDFAYGASCSDAYSSTLDDFQNNSFCAAQTTYSQYNRNSIHAQPDGLFRIIPGDSWFGACSSLLHREYAFDFGTAS